MGTETPWMLARPDYRIGVRYLGEALDRFGYTLTKYPVNAMLWEDLDDLSSWIDMLSPAVIRRLDREGFYPAPAIIEWSGCPVTFNPLESSAIRNMLRPIVQAKQLSLL